jgi:hypothetical protein
MSVLEQLREAAQGVQGVPRYVATRDFTNELVGIGPDSALVVNNWLWWSGYVHHLTHPLLALVACRNAPPAITLASYSEIRRQLEGLRNAPEADEFGRVRPSDAAIAAATRLTYAIVQAGLEMPMIEDVSTDSDGAIRILWEEGGRRLELVCPFNPSQRPYWYHSDLRTYAVEYDHSPEAVRALVNWLNNGIVHRMK